jgi:hypothetical protein
MDKPFFTDVDTHMERAFFVYTEKNQVGLLQILFSYFLPYAALVLRPPGQCQSVLFINPTGETRTVEAGSG